MKIRNEDVTYTEALNIVLLRGFLQPGKGVVNAFWKEEEGTPTKADYEALLEGYDPKQLALDGLIDSL